MHLAEGTKCPCLDSPGRKLASKEIRPAEEKLLGGSESCFQVFKEAITVSKSKSFFSEGLEAW